MLGFVGLGTAKKWPVLARELFGRGSALRVGERAR
jgi:hypothetical protein